MKRLFFTATFFLILSTGLMAQSKYQISEAIHFFNANKYSRGDTRSMLEAANIEGSPYLNDEFVEGSVFTKSKTQFVGIPLRYNVYEDQIEFKSDKGEVQVLAAPEMMDKIEFGEYKMVYIPYSVTKKIKRGFFIEMVKGDQASLFFRPTVIFKRAQKPAAYQDAEPARFIQRSNEYFIRVGKEPAKLISRKKDLRKAFPEHQKDVKSFIKKNNVRPNKPERLEKLVRYYNSL
jgi:hypothetical protein